MKWYGIPKILVNELAHTTFFLRQNALHEPFHEPQKFVKRLAKRGLRIPSNIYIVYVTSTPVDLPKSIFCKKLTTMTNLKYKYLVIDKLKQNIMYDEFIDDSVLHQLLNFY